MYGVTCVVFNPIPDIYLLVAAYQEGELVLSDTLDCRVLTRASSNAHILVSSPNGRTLASSDSEGTIRIFEFKALALLYQLQTESFIQQLEFSGDGKYLLDSATDNVGSEHQQYY